MNWHLLGSYQYHCRLYHRLYQYHKHHRAYLHRCLFALDLEPAGKRPYGTPPVIGLTRGNCGCRRYSLHFDQQPCRDWRCHHVALFRTFKAILSDFVLDLAGFTTRQGVQPAANGIVLSKLESCPAGICPNDFGIHSIGREEGQPVVAILSVAGWIMSGTGFVHGRSATQMVATVWPDRREPAGDPVAAG